MRFFQHCHDCMQFETTHANAAHVPCKFNGAGFNVKTQPKRGGRHLNSRQLNQFSYRHYPPCCINYRKSRPRRVTPEIIQIARASRERTAYFPNCEILCVIGASIHQPDRNLLSSFTCLGLGTWSSSYGHGESDWAICTLPHPGSTVSHATG